MILRSISVLLLLSMLPRFVQGDVTSYKYSGFTDIFSDVYASRPQWSSDGQWIVFDDHEQNFILLHQQSL